MKTLATLIALCIGFLLPLQSSAFAQKGTPVARPQKHTLPQNPLVNELTKQSLQRSNGWAPPYRPGTIPESNATKIVKSWEQDSVRGRHAPAGLDVFGNDMSVFMLERNRTNTGFIASSDIPSVNGKISTKGAIWIISSQDPLSGKKVTSLALSGAVWTPRTIAVKKLNLAGADRITASPDFSFDAFKNSPGVVPFANGYAVNLFGQKLRQDGVLDTNPSLRGNYVTDDGRPLYGRLIRVRAAVPGTPAAIEEIILAPAAAAAPAAVQPHSNDSEAFFRRGAADDDKGQYDRAIEEYTHAIRLNPNYAAAFYNRGLDYDDEAQYDRAIADYDQATRLSPNDPDVFVIRGLAYAHKGQYDRAIQDYNQAIKLKASDALAFYDRGLAYEKDRQFDRAIQDFDQAIRLNPNDADAYLSRGHAKQAKGDSAGGQADIAKARQLNPKLPAPDPLATAPTDTPRESQQQTPAWGTSAVPNKVSQSPASQPPPVVAQDTQIRMADSSSAPNHSQSPNLLAPFLGRWVDRKHSDQFVVVTGADIQWTRGAGREVIPSGNCKPAANGAVSFTAHSSSSAAAVIDGKLVQPTADFVMAADHNELSISEGGGTLRDPSSGFSFTTDGGTKYVFEKVQE